jgi:hypothetical protein
VRLLLLLPEHHSRKIAASQEKRFFFEKKNQKTFARLGGAQPERPEPSNQKFFASFFQKRRPSSACLCFNHNLLPGKWAAV